MNEQICFSILMTRKYLKFEFKFQVPSISGLLGQKKKFVCLFNVFFGEITARLWLDNFVSRSTDLYSAELATDHPGKQWALSQKLKNCFVYTTLQSLFGGNIQTINRSCPPLISTFTPKIISFDFIDETVIKV